MILQGNREATARAEESVERLRRRVSELDRVLAGVRSEAGVWSRIRLLLFGSARIRDLVAYLPRRPSAVNPAEDLPAPIVLELSEARRAVSLRVWRLRVARFSLLGQTRAAFGLGGTRIEAALSRGWNGISPAAGRWARFGSRDKATRISAVVCGRPHRVGASARRLRSAAGGASLSVTGLARPRGEVCVDRELVDRLERESGEFVLVCHELVAADPGWLEELVEILDSDEGLGVAVPRVSEGCAYSVEIDGDGVRLRDAFASREDSEEAPALVDASCALFRRGALDFELDKERCASLGWGISQCVSLAESGLRVGFGDREVSIRRSALSAADEARVLARWGPQLRRRARADLLRGGGRWCRRGARTLVVGTIEAAASIDRFCGELGWVSVDEAGDPDVSVELNDGGLSVRPFDGHPHRRFPAVDPVQIPEGPGGFAAERVGAATETVFPDKSIAIQLSAPSWSAARTWGDYYLALALRDALVRSGFEASLSLAGEEMGETAGDDVRLHIRGRRPGARNPGQLNVVWLISHPEDVGHSELDRYDLVLVASEPYAASLRERLEARVETFLQFTDPDVFSPTPSQQDAHQVLFVGNWRGEFRKVVRDLLPTELELALVGSGWDRLAPEHAIAEWVPNDELSRLYSSCGVLLADHWDDMRRNGFVSNRIFDALACEAYVIADRFGELDRITRGTVDTYESEDELREMLELAIEDPLRCRELGRRGREIVLRSHTADHRASALIELIGPRLEAQSLTS